MGHGRHEAEMPGLLTLGGTWRYDRLPGERFDSLFEDGLNVMWYLRRDWTTQISCHTQVCYLDIIYHFQMMLLHMSISPQKLILLYNAREVK